MTNRHLCDCDIAAYPAGAKQEFASNDDVAGGTFEACVLRIVTPRDAPQEVSMEVTNYSGVCT